MNSSDEETNLPDIPYTPIGVGQRIVFKPPLKTVSKPKKQKSGQIKPLRLSSYRLPVNKYIRPGNSSTTPVISDSSNISLEISSSAENIRYVRIGEVGIHILKCV